MAYVLLSFEELHDLAVDRLETLLNRVSRITEMTPTDELDTIYSDGYAALSLVSDIKRELESPRPVKVADTPTADAA